VFDAQHSVGPCDKAKSDGVTGKRSTGDWMFSADTSALPTSSLMTLNCLAEAPMSWLHLSRFNLDDHHVKSTTAVTGTRLPSFGSSVRSSRGAVS
jgi:hypothetical protein